MSSRGQSLSDAVSRAEIVIIAVRPDAVRGLLGEIQLVALPSGEPRRPLLAISLAAGVPLKVLRARLGAPVRWAPCNAEPVCRMAKGLTGLAFSRDITPSDQRKIRSLFARVGIVLEIPEKQFVTFSVTYSSSHGYHALSALAESAIKIGLDFQTAIAAARRLSPTVSITGGKGKTTIAELLNEAATPGGVAEATMSEMDKSGYRRAIQNGLRAGLRRTRANAKRSK